MANVSKETRERLVKELVKAPMVKACGEELSALLELLDTELAAITTKDIEGKEPVTVFYAKRG